MSFVSVGGGITKLSELIIDADKVWADKGISSIKELALGMLQGDILVHDGTRMIRIAASVANMVLTSTGVLSIPVWAPGGTYYNRYFPATISLSKALAIVAAAQAIAKNAALATSHFEAYDDQPASMMSRLTPTLASVDAEDIVVAARTYDKSPATIGRDISIGIDGAVSETWAGAQTDETAVAKSAALNDMNLNPMTPHVDDLYYFGFARVFSRMWLNLSTPGVGNWVNIFEYWNGAAWVACVDEDDQSSEFQAASGWKRIQWTPQGDWALHVVMGMNLYWVRSHTTAYVNQATKPLGAQVFCCLVT